MRRTVEQAFLDLRQHLLEWKNSGGRPGLRIFVYPPEWEALMLARFPKFADESASACPIALVDVGQGFLQEMQRRKGFVDRLVELEAKGGQERLLHDLGQVAERYLRKLVAEPLEPRFLARVLVNTGSLGPFVSYSAIGNALDESGSDEGVAAPTVLAFPGEGDERSLNLLRLRADTNYRVPRI